MKSARKRVAAFEAGLGELEGKVADMIAERSLVPAVQALLLARQLRQLMDGLKPTDLSLPEVANLLAKARRIGEQLVGALEGQN